jgi:(E)-4-hydroxy-3-methylbut-2-enyl-diphosphate synthase
MNWIHHRLITKEVKVGDLGIGGKNPIRIQSMTNENTLDTDAVVKQTIELVNAECELVRITAPGIAEAENLKTIKKKLRSMGYPVPLIADIHFSAKAAEIAARYVEKVRINPGNYADKKQFKQIDYTDLEYNFELERISERIKPLIEICKQEATAMRIGVNHGSLSDRIISRYGDTPMGMAMSALEYAEICLSLGYNNLVFSMKSSDVKVMIYSTRLLVNLFHQKGMNFPIHVGVTEAGAGEDGRIRSAAGIGALLSEGIGDTIRVSLTESPTSEIPVAQQIIHPFSLGVTKFVDTPLFVKPIYPNHNPFEYSLRTPHFFSERAVIISNYTPIRDEDLSLEAIHDFLKIEISASMPSPLKRTKATTPIILSSDSEVPIQQVKDFIRTHLSGNTQPLIIKRNYPSYSIQQVALHAAADIGALTADGLVNGIYLKSDSVSAQECYNLSLDIFQACGLRYYKTEIISCPSCGRTNYDIETLLQQVKQRLSGFEGLKIAVMGCVVNGPGEMSDADYGLVGAGEGKLWLYKGKTPVVKNIPQSEAADRLLAYIKADYLKESPDKNYLQ